MPPDPMPVYAALGALIGGLATFALLLLAGVTIVRRLGLPQDLPEIPRFEPPPPALREQAERVAAHATALHQARLRALYASGLATLRAAQQCQEFALAGKGLEENRGTQVAVAMLARTADAALAAATAADQTLRRLDPLLRSGTSTEQEIAESESAVASAAQAAQAALAEAQQAAQALPDPHGRRRLWVLLALALVLALWMIAMSILTRR